MFSKAHVNVTHNATQRLKKVIFGLALPTECVCRKLSDQTVVMTEKEKKKEHMPPPPTKNSYKGNTMIFAFGFF